MADDERALNALRDAIDAFGEELAPEVVARARAEAVARASSILAEAMAHSLLDHARPLVAHEPLDEPEPSDDPEPAPPGGAERDDIELAHYVYGVARAGAGAWGCRRGSGAAPPGPT